MGIVSVESKTDPLTLDVSCALPSPFVMVSTKGLERILRCICAFTNELQYSRNQ